MTTNIKSNIPNLGTQIQVLEENNGEPRKIITEILKKHTQPTLIQLIFVGRRLITQKNLKLLSGRRHRKFWGLRTNSKFYIKYCWHKIKHLTKEEMDHLEENWHLDYFNDQGKHLIEQSGGLLYPHNLIYKKMKIIF